MDIDIIANSMVEPGMSGGNKIFIELAKRWNNQSNKIRIYTSDVGKEICEKNGLGNVNFYTWSSKEYKKYGIIGLYISGIIKGILLPLEYETNKKAVVWSTSDFLPDSIPGFLMSRKNSIWIAAFQLVIPSPFSKDFPYKGTGVFRGILAYTSQVFAYWIIKKWADIVIVFGEYDIKKFITQKREKDKVIAIGGGVDINLPDLVPLAVKRYDAVFLGRLHPQKGIMELIDIWKYICNVNNNARLAIIGNGEMGSYIREKIAQYNLTNNIDMLGFMDGIDKVKVFKESKVFLYPAILDHWSIAPVEGMICGLPVITFDLPCLKSYPAIRGIIRVPMFDLNAYAESIINLINDGALYKKVQSDAVEWAKSWDWNSRAEEVLNKIEEVHKIA